MSPTLEYLLVQIQIPHWTCYRSGIPTSNFININWSDPVVTGEDRCPNQHCSCKDILTTPNRSVARIQTKNWTLPQAILMRFRQGSWKCLIYVYCTSTSLIQARSLCWSKLDLILKHSHTLVSLALTLLQPAGGCFLLQQSKCWWSQCIRWRRGQGEILCRDTQNDDKVKRGLWCCRI